MSSAKKPFDSIQRFDIIKSDAYRFLLNNNNNNFTLFIVPMNDENRRKNIIRITISQHVYRMGGQFSIFQYLLIQITSRIHTYNPTIP